MDVAERNQIVERNLGLVRQIARSLVRRTRGAAEYDDLVSDGVIGLMKCIERFDPSRGVQFSTFAGMRIRGAMLDGMRVRDHLSRQQRAEYTLAGDGGRRIDIDKLDPMRIPTVSGDDVGLREDFRELVLRGMTYVEQAIIDLYWFEGATMREIGEALELSESRVSQIHAELLVRLRERLSRRIDS